MFIDPFALYVFLLILVLFQRTDVMALGNIKASDEKAKSDTEVSVAIVILHMIQKLIISIYLQSCLVRMFPHSYEVSAIYCDNEEKEWSLGNACSVL